MDTLSLGIFNVIPCCVLWIFSRVSAGTYDRTSAGKRICNALYEEFLADSVSFSNKINARLEKEKDCDYLWSYIKDSSLTDLPKNFIRPIQLYFILSTAMPLSQKMEYLVSSKARVRSGISRVRPCKNYLVILMSALIMSATEMSRSTNSLPIL